MGTEGRPYSASCTSRTDGTGQCRVGARRRIQHNHPQPGSALLPRSVQTGESVERSAEIQHEISKDLTRTFPTHAFYRSAQGRRALANVLGAYSLHNPSIGCASATVHSVLVWTIWGRARP